MTFGALRSPLSGSLRRALAGAALLAGVSGGALAAGAFQVASLSPAEINRDTAQAQPVDLIKLNIEAPPGSDVVEIGYKIHLGGFHLMQVSMRSILHDGEYVAYSYVETKGLVDAFASAKINIVSTGEVVDGRVTPRTYNSDQQEKKKRQLVGLLFGDNGDIDIASDPPYDLERFPVSAELKKQTVDPLSAALFISLGSAAARGDPCTRTVPVFDGKRRYNLNMTYIGEEDISLGRDNFKGKAAHCRLNYERVAGFKPPKPGKSKTDVPPIDVWLAPFNNGKIYVPVRMQADSDFGGAVVRATELKVSQVPAKL